MQSKLARLRSLLDYADHQQREISNEYSNYSEGNIPPSLQIKVKNYFENARSLLDYIASDICVHVLRLDEKHKCYFPIYSRSQEDFVRFCKASFPGIERIAPDIYSILVGVQPFQTTEFAPLKQLVKYTNENKHRDLTAHSMVEEIHAASRFMVIRLGDIKPMPSIEGIYDGFLVADETRSDPFLGSDYIIGNIGKVIELDPASFRYTSFKFANSGEDIIVALMNVQSTVTEVVERFAEPLYGQSW